MIEGYKIKKLCINMLFLSVLEFRSAIPAEGRLVGLDLGMRRIGIAISDTRRLISSPHTIIERKNIKKDINKIIFLLNEFAATGLVIGYPLKLDGTESSLCEVVIAFAKKICTAKEIPILLQDERMSSISASRVLSEYGISSHKRSQLEDKIAASFILQAAIDTV